MNEWSKGVTFGILILLIIGFVLYNYFTKAFIKEGFQATNNDYKYGFFDVSANYYKLSSAEKSGGFTKTADQTILNVGNMFDAINPNAIPWDSENRELSPNDILWGFVPSEASVSLYYKMFIAEKLESLKLAQDNEYYYESPLLHYGTNNQTIGNIAQVGDFIANFVAPFIQGAIGGELAELAKAKNEVIGSLREKVDNIMAPIREQEALDKEIKKLSEEIRSLSQQQKQEAVVKDKNKIFTENPNGRKRLTKSDIRQLARMAPSAKYKFGKKPSEIKLPEQKLTELKNLKNQIIKAKILKITSQVFNIYFEWLALLPEPWDAIMSFIYMTFIMPLIMALAMPLIAPVSGKIAYIENQVAGVSVTLVAMAVSAGAQVVAETAAKANPLLQPAATAAKYATLGSALAGALAAFFLQKDAVPNNYRSIMEGMMASTGHGNGDGKCPAGYKPLNEVLDPTLEMFISFVPIAGDLLDLMYPYTCVTTEFPTNHSANNLICLRDPYILPNFMDYSWISSKYLEWPDYNGKYSFSENVFQGKKRITPNALNPAITSYYSWDNYVNFMDVANNPNAYCNVNIKMENIQRKYTYEYIGGYVNSNVPNPNNGFKFFYLDFTEPSILVEMAQFYYNYAIKNPFPNEDGTVSVQYITKINYVIASSLFTCDCMCEMLNVTYNPLTGEKLREETSFDSDRRFYFTWRPDFSKPNPSGGYYCKSFSNFPIWGNCKTDTTKGIFKTDTALWKVLEDTYDEMMYQLNDAIHFPNDPNAESTGLVDGRVLLTAYEIYKENKERSDYASSYIYSAYTSSSDFQRNYPTLYSTLVSTKTAFDAVSSVTITTGALGGQTSLTSAQSNYINAYNAYNNALASANPNFLDLVINTNIALSNYINVLNLLYTNNENKMLFTKNNIVFNESPIIDDLQTKMNNVILARSYLWNLHQSDRPVFFNYDIQFNYMNYINLQQIGRSELFVSKPVTYTAPTLPDGSHPEDLYHEAKYFDVVGCTFADGTAQTAITPDVTYEQFEMRFPVQFDVTPYLRRCPFVNITTDRCIDLSNVQQVIQSYKIQNPDKRIKSIHSIKGKGKNVCQYIWDEYSITNPSVITRTSNNILYQMDLSSCTFCLPQDSSGKKVLYVDGRSGTGTSIQTVPAINPPTFYTKTTNPPNPNSILAFSNAEYNKPNDVSETAPPRSFTYTTTSNTMPRYDPATFKQLPDLVRPKKPIRVTYPNPPESNLGNQLSNVCGDPVNMSNFLLRYNQNTSNLDKILKIQRAFTTSANTCQYEVDMLINTPKKGDGSDYASHTIENILTINIDETEISMDVSTEGYYVGSVINVSFDNGQGFVYKLSSDNDTTPLRVENYTAYSTDSNVKGIFQAIQGLRTIRDIDVSAKKITYANDSSRFPKDIDDTTIEGNIGLFAPYAGDFNNSGLTKLAFTVARSTINANMNTVPPLGSLTEPFSNTPYTYQTLSTVPLPNPELQINKHTSTLNGVYSNSGYGFEKAYDPYQNAKFGPNTNYFNKNLVSNYVTTTSNLRDSSRALLSNIYNTNVKLSNGAYLKTCDDPAIMQRIMDSYNNFSTPTGIFNQEKNTMIQIIQSSTDVNNQCHVIFENKNEQFFDYYSTDLYNSNNYIPTNTLMFKRFPMVYDNSISDFKPDMNSVNFNSTLRASDLALSLGTNFTTYKKSLRGNNMICQVDGNITSPHFIAFSNWYNTNTPHTINNVIKSLNIGYDRTDYIVKQTMRNGTYSLITSNIIRVRYSLNPFNLATPNLCSWSFNSTLPEAYRVQMVVPTVIPSGQIDPRTKLTYNYIQFITDVPTNLTLSDNISPLFNDSEYTGAKPSDVYQRF